MIERDPSKYQTSDGKPTHPEFSGQNSPAPQPVNPETGQHRAYWVLSDEERAKGFCRPVRRTYRHRACGTSTRMGSAIAETYAREPKFYGSTFCVECRAHLPVSEFTWEDGETVGT